MDNKCPKYEQLFIFGTEQELKKHVESCSECKDFHKKMEKVASLVKETKPLIKKRSNNKYALKAVAAVFAVFIAYFAIMPVILNQNSDLDMLSMIDTSPIAQMGLPTDDYGFLVIE